MAHVVACGACDVVEAMDTSLAPYVDGPSEAADSGGTVVERDVGLELLAVGYPVWREVEPDLPSTTVIEDLPRVVASPSRYVSTATGTGLYPPACRYLLQLVLCGVGAAGVLHIVGVG